MGKKSRIEHSLGGRLALRAADLRLLAALLLDLLKRRANDRAVELGGLAGTGVTRIVPRGRGKSSIKSRTKGVAIVRV